MTIRSLLFLSLACFAQQSKDFRFALTGDSILNRSLSVHGEPAYLSMIERIRAADAAFTNLETLIHNFEMPAAAQSGGTYMASPPSTLRQLQWAGFDFVSLANNHVMDYGPEGLLTTLRHLRESGLVHAGAGRNLALARAPAYLETAKGRVALISCASTFPPGSNAGEQRRDLIGRPGLNPLRYSTTITIDKTGLESLRKAVPASPADGPDRLRMPGFLFVAGDTPGIRRELYQPDLNAITASIKEARRQADWVVVSIHAHEGAPRNREEPADFLIEFARASIDAGADLFVGHGPHVLRAVEIYKGKPIFYSLANFIFENETVLYQPAENYEQYQLPPDALPADFYDARSRNDTRGFPADPLNWESVIAEVSFAGDRTLKGVTLLPITLAGPSRTQRGRPRPAAEPQAQSIIGRLAKLSEPYQTVIQYQNGAGVVKLSPR
ncbi:MAG: CapA family protein [Acidimicrobiia bacterium]|nr:CapA family protein [Acidimicrobiia bacterium]